MVYFGDNTFIKLKDMDMWESSFLEEWLSTYKRYHMFLACAKT
jgi:hypothetical protein